MRIAITGGTGFIGRAVVGHFAARGHTIHAFGRRANNPISDLPTVIVHTWDIATGPYPDPPAVDVVIHCAGAVAAWGPYPGFFRTNVEGMRHLLATFPAVPRLIFISSASVYDPFRDQDGITEDAPAPAHFVSAYGKSKLLAEQILLASGRPAVILRPRAVYGVGDTTLLPRLLRAYRFGRQIVLGSGSNRISITALENLLLAIERGLRYDGPAMAFNIADDIAPTLNELLTALLRAFGREPHLFHLPRPVAWQIATWLEGAYNLVYRTGASPDKTRDPLLTRYAVAEMTRTCVLDCSRARVVLGYHPVATYRDVLPELAAALRASPRASLHPREEGPG
jgi:nucleoside-diphosphate-sugar epimerase